MEKLNIIIIGLGNPGPEYQNTRHNVGFTMIELLAEQLNLSVRNPFLQPCRWWKHKGIKGDLILVEPLTFMNRSGNVIPWILKKFKVKPDQILVVLDNMDLIPGRLRMKPRGSSAGHNGLKSIISVMESECFHRLYIGIGRPSGGSIIDHVLGIPSEADQESIQQSIHSALGYLKELPEISLDEVRDGINNL